MRAELINELERYIPFNDQEKVDKAEILKALRETQDIFLRSNSKAHMTSSGWVINQDHTKVLMAYHNIYNSWAWLGGHADGNEDLLEVAVKEVKEESGLSAVDVLESHPFSIEILPVEGHLKNGNYISSHIHLNITYLLSAHENENLQIKEDENSNVAWFYLNDAVNASSEKWFRERIYPKLNEKVRHIDF